jgi:hypothetical protein
MNPDFDWSLSSIGGNEYEYTYATKDGEVKVSYTKNWTSWDGYNMPLIIAFQVQVLSGAHAGKEFDYYFYSEARKERDRYLANGVCAVLRCING